MDCAAVHARMEELKVHPGDPRLVSWSNGGALQRVGDIGGTARVAVKRDVHSQEVSGDGCHAVVKQQQRRATVSTCYLQEDEVM